VDQDFLKGAEPGDTKDGSSPVRSSGWQNPGRRPGNKVSQNLKQNVRSVYNY